MTISSKYSIFLLVLVVLLGACGCEKPKPQEEPQQDPQEEQIIPADMSLVELSVPVTDNWVWSGKPQITIHITNNNAGAVKLGTKVVITTDKKAEVVTLTDSVVIGTKKPQDVVITGHYDYR